METIRENYWGASEMEHIQEELLKRSAASANIAQLLFQANITTLKMSDYGDMLAEGTEEQRRSVEAAMMMENRFRTSFGIQLLSRDDTLENHAYSFAGLSEIYEQFMMDMAGAAEIPATKLFGRSPQGMNATGEADLENWYNYLERIQRRMLRRNLRHLLELVFRAGVNRGQLREVPAIRVRFLPLWSLSEEEQAALEQKRAQAQLLRAQAARIYLDMGAVTAAEVRQALADTGAFDVETMLDN